MPRIFEKVFNTAQRKADQEKRRAEAEVAGVDKNGLMLHLHGLDGARFSRLRALVEGKPVTGPMPTTPIIPSIPTVSNNINPRLTTFFTNNPSGRFGAVGEGQALCGVHGPSLVFGECTDIGLFAGEFHAKF